MKMIMNAFQPSYKSKAKNYKYFYRGQYSVMPDADDIIQGMKEKKQKLQKYEESLKKFQYKKALNQALEQRNPEVVLALIEELIQRDALEISLANRTPDELIALVNFIQWKISDYRYQSTLVQVLRFLIDMYQGILGTGHSPELDSLFGNDLYSKLGQEIEQSENLIMLSGQIEMVQKMTAMFH